MKQVQIKGNMIPKVLELIEAKRGGNQPILSFHSTEPNADVYSLYLDDLLDYIENVKKYACKATAEKYHAEIIKAIESVPNATKEFTQAWKSKNDKICKEITEGKNDGT